MRIVAALPARGSLTGSADPVTVGDLIETVRRDGDAGVRALTRRFDGVDVADHRVPAAALAEAFGSLPVGEQEALRHALANIRRVAEAQRGALGAFEVEVESGVFIGQRVLPIRRVACYVPGGRYPLPSTVLMTVVPARVAGCEEVVVISPPGPNGWPARHILAAAWLAGADAVHAVGGVQAIAAAAWGTATLGAVDLIVGPGNAWVTEAKRQVFGQVGIDALAGPSEVMVLADGRADAERVAADLLAQAEHDPDAEPILVTDSAALAAAVVAAVEAQLADLPTADIARRSIATHGYVVLVADLAAMIAVANERAPEHLHLAIAAADAAAVAAACTACGALFVGDDAPEVFGDYCSGSNHVLPTVGAARYTGGLGVHSFVRLGATQRVAPAAAAGLARTAAVIARVEGLEAHARAAELRAVAIR